MKLPLPILKVLASKGIVRPTPIQMQGIPVALSGRDMIGVAFTGSGKTLAFCLPMVLLALESEQRLPFVHREGPFALQLGPSRELTRQTYNIVKEFCDSLKNHGYPSIRVVLSMGGVNISETRREMAGGVHICVGTTGRVIDMLNKGIINLDLCKLFAL